MVTFSKPKRGFQMTVNVDRDGVPFGQIWTFRDTASEWHPWHAKLINGEHKAFYGATKADGYEKAKHWMATQAS